MPQLHRAFSWFIDDDVLHIQKTDGALSARVYRAVFVGISVAAVVIVVGLVAWLVHTTRSRPAADAFVIIVLIMGVVLAFSPTVLLLREAAKPYRLTISAAGLTSVSLLVRRRYALERVEAIVARRYQTHSRVPGGGSRLEAQLFDSRRVVLLESKQSESIAEFEPIISFFDALRSQRTSCNPGATGSNDAR